MLALARPNNTIIIILLTIVRFARTIHKHVEHFIPAVRMETRAIAAKCMSHFVVFLF